MKELLKSSVARIVFAATYIIFGLFHFIAADDLLKLVPTFMPGGIIWVYLAGAFFLFAAITIILNKFAKIGGNLLGIMLLIFAFAVWLPQASINPLALTNALKDLGLAMAAFIIANDSN